MKRNVFISRVFIELQVVSMNKGNHSIDGHNGDTYVQCCTAAQGHAYNALLITNFKNSNKY